MNNELVSSTANIANVKCPIDEVAMYNKIMSQQMEPIIEFRKLLKKDYYLGADGLKVLDPTRYNKLETLIDYYNEKASTHGLPNIDFRDKSNQFYKSAVGITGKSRDIARKTFLQPVLLDAKLTAPLSRLVLAEAQCNKHQSDIMTSKLIEFAMSAELNERVLSADNVMKDPDLETSYINTYKELMQSGTKKETVESVLVEKLSDLYDEYKQKASCETLIEDWTDENVLAKIDYSKGCSAKTKKIGLILLGLVMIVGILLMVVPIVRKKGTFSTDVTSPDEEKNTRQANRGMLASVLVSIFFGGLNGFVDGTGNVDPSTSTALFGMLLGGTVGYLADNGLGSDTGLRIYQKEGIVPWMKFMFGKIATGSFLRYQVTILFDTFVSLILFKPLYEWMTTSLPFFKCPGYGSFANAILSASISMITFNAYANQTRFLWAYPDSNSQSKQTWIKGSTMLLATTVMSMIFLGTNTIIGYNPEKITTGNVGGKEINVIKIHECFRNSGGLNSPKIKIILVVFVLGLLTFMSMTNNVEPELARNLVFMKPEDLKGDEYRVTLIELQDIASGKIENIENFGDDEIEETKENIDNTKQGLLVPVWIKNETLASPENIKNRSRKGVLIFAIIVMVAAFGTYATSKNKNKFLPPAIISGILLALSVPAFL